jgi:CTP:molybdopterin cytidylyltransferase MocA
MDGIIAHRSGRTALAARQCAVLVLAAGGSRRLGRPKQLVASSGQALVARTVGLARALGPRWLGVVLGAGAGRVKPALNGLADEIIVARDWHAGMAASLRRGVGRVPADARYLLVMTVDQWQLQSRDLADLLAAAGRIPVAAAYDGRLGVPAIFPRAYIKQLGALRGDQGARRLLTQGTAIAVPMPRAAADLDTPADLAAYRARPRRA